MTKILNICFCSDKNLVKHIPTVINSILNNNAKYYIKIHYIHDIAKIEENNDFKKLKNFVAKHKNLQIKTYLKTWNAAYNGLKHVTVATMLRIFIPNIIHEDKVLYLDIDLIVNTDLTDLYNIDCGHYGIAMKESLVEPDGCTVIKIDGKKSGNCGVIMMNLDTLRKNKFVEKCLEIHSRFNGEKHDQFIINMYCKCNYQRLKYFYNLYINQDSHLVKLQKQFILHYAGMLKPYSSNVGEYQYLWDKASIPTRLNCFQYWDTGKYGMPVFIKHIYNHNLKQSIDFNFNLILITDNNVNSYFKPQDGFFKLDANIKSNIVRYNVLDKYGGIWLDTDIIIIKNLNILYNNMNSSEREVVIDKDFNSNLNSGSLVMKKNSTSTNFCLKALNECLHSNDSACLQQISSSTIEQLSNTMPEKITINDSTVTSKGSNFLDINDTPGINKHKWIFSPDVAAKTAALLKSTTDCYFVRTSTIYKEHNINGDIINFVFGNPMSVFSYLV
jgi:lipopolysaccharide biosynthesis glycosyltransferase